MTRATAILAALLLCAGAAGHQRASAQEAPGSSVDGACEGQVIGQVIVDNHTIFVEGADSSDNSGWRAFADKARSIANRAHQRTRRGFIEDELLFKAGDCYDPLLIDESQRLLRALPFIADADVSTVPVSANEVNIVVDTRDDWTLKLDVRFEFDDGLKITHVGFTEENLGGTGTLLGFYLVERDERRDVGLELSRPRLVGTRLDGRFGGGRTRTGVFFHESLIYPFVGEVGRWAFVESYSLREDLFRYAASAESDFTNVSLPIQTRRAALTLGLRLGTPGDLTVVAAGLSWEDIRYENFPNDVTVVRGFDFSNPDTADATTVETLRPQVIPKKAARLNFVAGKRNIRFIQRRGLDAIRGEQDIRVGTQALLNFATTLGTPVSAPGNEAHEVRGGISLFGGAAGASWTFNSELSFEAARLFAGTASSGTFRDVLGEVGAYFYWQPALAGRSTPAGTESIPRHTFVLGLAGAGGWNSSLPFQLTLGGPFGIRGYDREEFPAGQRLVAHVEDRITLGGPLRDVFDLGLTLFMDAGAGWNGNVPFGMDTGLQGTAGAGLRLGFPAEARQVVRMDLAVPMKEGVGFGDLQFRIGYDAVSLLSGFGDRQLRRSRSESAATAIFGRQFNR